MSRSRMAMAGVLVGLVALMSGGCSDMITFAGDARDAGLKAYAEARYPDAAGAFRAALKQDPRDYQSHYYLGLSNLKLGAYQQAMVNFRACLDTRMVTLAGQEDDATAAKALDGLAQAIVKADEQDLEVNKIEQAARNAKGTQAGREYIVLAKVYRYRGLPDMALDYYNRACLSDNRNFGYLKEYGLYAEQLQQQAKAEQSLRQAYAINGRDAEVSEALKRLGVVPGPSLLAKDELNKPLMPKGPIPEVDWSKVGLGGKKPAAGTPGTPAQPGTTPGNAAMPRD
ncbi:MAG TPA: hypothetical protein VEA69_24450 [Tepidisphaeraceae bacterium]|nr:hypothetical protein [Tepidisphaeraceae bacterium]